MVDMDSINVTCEILVGLINVSILDYDMMMFINIEV